MTFLGFLQQQTKNYQKQTEEWTERYNYEVTTLDSEISKIKEEILEIKLKHGVMEEAYLIRQEDIDEYLTEKNIRDEAIALTERQWDSAVKIQSWWKGIMVRKGLGPYRRKKGKSAKKAKKSKKKA